MKIRLSYVWLGLLLAAGLTACGSATAVPTATSMPPTPTATLAPTLAPSPTVASTPTEVVVTDACVTCHTDKDQLISTADQVVEEVEESEGAG